MRFFQLLILICLASFAFGDVIVDEGFEGGVVPPTDWQVWDEGEPGCSVWDITIVTPHTGTYCAYHSDASIDSSYSWLVTDTYDFSYYSTVSYSFWRDLSYASYYYYTGFMYSTVENPTSSDFTELVELGNLLWVWEEFTGDVTTECSGEQYVTFAWYYIGGYDHSERIDDLLITGDVALERDTWGSIKSTF